MAKEQNKPRDKEVVQATLREMNYLLGLRNKLSEEVQESLENPADPEQREFQEDLVESIVDRLEGGRDHTHPVRSLRFEDEISRAAQDTSLRCESCMGIGVSPDGGICRHCEGTGIDLSKRPRTGFLLWSQQAQEALKPEASQTAQNQPQAAQPQAPQPPLQRSDAPSPVPAASPAGEAAPPAETSAAGGWAFLTQRGPKE